MKINKLCPEYTFSIVTDGKGTMIWGVVTIDEENAGTLTFEVRAGGRIVFTSDHLDAAVMDFEDRSL